MKRARKPLNRVARLVAPGFGLCFLLLVPTGLEAASKHKLRPYGEAELPLLACVALGEAAGEGEQGISLVLDTMANRHWRWNRYAYSAQFRPHLADFCAAQPATLRRYADHQVAALYQGRAVPQTAATHYVTSWLYHSPTRPAWVGRMKVIQVYRNHVFMVEPS